MSNIFKAFRCKSCGSNQIIKKKSKYICEYCNASYIYANPLRQKRIFILVLILILSIIVFTAYSIINDDKSKTKLKTKSYITYNINELLPSQRQGHYKKRQKALSKWMQASDYEDRLNNDYYKNKNTYIAYQILNKKSYRRILELPIVIKNKKQIFEYTVKSAMELKDFQKVHLNCEENGQRLLSMTTYYMNKRTYYSGTWVSAWAYDKEVLRLKEYGVFPPELLVVGPGNTFSKGYNTLLTFYINTSNQKDAETHAKVYLIINDKEKILLGKGYSQYRKRGIKHTNRFGSKYTLNEIEKFTLKIEGNDEWKFDKIAITMIDRMRNFITYKINKIEWLSEDINDIKKLNAKKSYTFTIDEMTRTN